MRRKQGFTLIEVMIVIMIISIVLSIALPQMMTARQNAWTKTCQTNLRAIDSAKSAYAIEANLPPGTTVTAPDIAPYLKSVPTCPAGGTYDYTTIDVPPACDHPGHTLP